MGRELESRFGPREGEMEAARFVTYGRILPSITDGMQGGRASFV
jgi:hypothetical protein